jgi:hypothetical protein
MIIHAVFLIIAQLLFSVDFDDSFVFDTSDDATSADSACCAVSVYISVYHLNWFRFICCSYIMPMVGFGVSSGEWLTYVRRKIVKSLG